MHLIRNVFFMLVVLWIPPGLKAMETGVSTVPMLRIETGMHIAKIIRIGIDAAEHYLVTASKDKTVRVWGLERGELLRVLRPPICEGNEGKIYAVAISPD